MNKKAKADAFVDEKFNITIKAPHIELTDPLRNYIFDKLDKIERFLPRLIDVVVNLDVQKLDHRADIVMRYNSTVIKSHGSSTDMYASIDMAIDKLQNQLRRYKSRIQDHHARGIKSVDMKVNVFHPHRNDDVDEVNEEIEKTNIAILAERINQPLASEKVPLKFLRLDEAIMKLELSGDVFLVYRGEEDRKLKIIYRRKDGKYAVIEPEA